MVLVMERQLDMVIKDKRNVQEHLLGFEGGQMTLYMRLPKRGFKKPNNLAILSINLNILNKFDDGSTINIDTLLKKGIIKGKFNGVKILENVNIEACSFSESAKKKIESLVGIVKVCSECKKIDKP